MNRAEREAMAERVYRELLVQARRERRASDPVYRAKQQEYMRGWNERNAAYKQQYGRAWRQRNPDYRKQWDAHNPEYKVKYNAAKRRRYASDPELREYRRNYGRERYANDPEVRAAALMRSRRQQLRQKMKGQI